MAWNEPGGGKDPWGGGSGANPPDLDAMLKKYSDKFGRFFGGGEGKGSGLLLGVLIVAAAVWFLLGIYQVDAKEKAVVLRFGVFDESYGIVGDGLHWNPPLIDTVQKENVTEERQYQSRGQMLTEDENIVELPLTVHYNIKNVRDFVLAVKSPESSLRQATDSALRHAVGSMKLDDVLSTGREQLSVDVQTRLQTYLDNYGTGINVVKVNILEGKPPSAVKAAYDDVIKAREDKERLINEAQAYSNGIIPEARGRAQRQLEEANAYKARVVAEAEGDARRFEQILSEFDKAPEVTRQRLYIDAISEVLENTSKVMVDVESGNNLLYLPLDKIVQRAPASKIGNNKSLSTSDISIIADEVIEKLRRQSGSSLRREAR
ncbi:MAG TPA: FtsH protease activity modulator HflK [Porticoccaceae bacterium]|nr:FtsH protease activity modulator HflK [Porticoccaceae bacterium]